MDIIFNCPHCEQELAVDSSGAGSSISCPACGEEITIPNSKGAPAKAADRMKRRAFAQRKTIFGGGFKSRRADGSYLSLVSPESSKSYIFSYWRAEPAQSA